MILLSFCRVSDLLESLLAAEAGRGAESVWRSQVDRNGDGDTEGAESEKRRGEELLRSAEGGGWVGGWVSCQLSSDRKDSLGETRGVIPGEGILGVEVGVGG